MKERRLEGGDWLFWISLVYLELGVIDLFVERFTEPFYLTAGYVILLSVPLYTPPLARFFNVKCIWEA